MPKPFANSAQITYSLVNGDWLLGIQTGNSTGDAGLPQMKHIKLSQLSDWVRGTYGQIWRYRGPFSASLPSDPQANDYFLATATFTVDSVTYTKDHLYAYNASGTWDDISDVLTQYASQAQVTDIDDRLTVAEEKIDAMGDGIVYKGKVATYADLAGIVDPQTGWEYYVTADAAFYIYNGASWDQIDNGIVQTITDGDTAHAPSGDAVYDALAAEAAARTAADSNLLSAIQGNSQRIENLEVAVSGSLVQTNVLTDPPSMANVRTITNANSILPWAILKRVGARAVAWNQLVRNILFAEEHADWSTNSPDTISVSDGVATITHNGTGATQLFQFINAESSHVYFVRGWFKTSASCKAYMRFGTYVDSPNKDISANTWVNVYGVVTGRSGSSEFNFYALNLPTGNTLQAKEGLCVDLTIMSMATGYTVDQLASIFCGSYGYDSGHIYNLNPSAFKVVGKNKWDEEWELGQYDPSTGVPMSSATAIRSKNFIPVCSNTTYFILLPAGVSPRVFFYDVNENFIGTVTESTFTTIAGTAFIKFHTSTQYGSSYNHNICLMLNSVTDKTYEAYKETTIDTSFTEDYLYVNENCHDYSENVLVDGQKMREEHRIVGSYTFTGNENLSSYPTSYTEDAYVYFIDERAETVNVLFGDGFRSNATYMGDMSLGSYRGATNSTGIIFLYAGITSVSDMQNFLTGKTVYYELATPTTPTLHDPIPNIPCEDGTTITAVTPQTDLVNAIDVPSTIAYMTKIGG